MKISGLFLVGILLTVGGTARAHDLRPNLKVLICAGDYGMWAQDRVPLIAGAVEKASSGSAVSWEAEQSFNFGAKLEAPGYAERFDTIVMGDIGVGQISTKAQQNLVDFVRQGGGLVSVVWAKSTLPFQDSEAVSMPLIPILPYELPDVHKPVADATVRASTDGFFKALDFAPLTQASIQKELPNLLMERTEGKGRVLALYGAFGPSWNRVRYATYDKVPGGWDAWDGLGELWSRVLDEASGASPIRGQSRGAVDETVKDQPLNITVTVDGTKTVDEIRAANFSIVALQQLYNEDGGAGEDLFLDLNPRDWFDRRSQEVLPNTKGAKADKPAFFQEFDIQGIYMGQNSYGSYGGWDEAKYRQQIADAVAAKKKWPEQLRFFQAGNEPPLDANYVAFHKKFVGGVLAQAPEYQVIGPNKAFNLLGVNPKEMQFYLDECGATTDVLNWHTYAQPPSTVLAEARYWSDKAAGKMRAPGPAKVMFTESDAWNQGASQFNYLMTRAFTFLPEPRIIGNFQYCMRPRSEGGTYKFGVLQPEGEFAANYNGYWVWRNLRGKMTATEVAAPAGAEHVHAISSRSAEGKTFTTVLYYDAGYFDGAAGSKASNATISVRPKLPAGNYNLEISEVRWDKRSTRPVPSSGEITVRLGPCEAAALTWTLQP